MGSLELLAAAMELWAFRLSQTSLGTSDLSIEAARERDKGLSSGWVYRASLGSLSTFKHRPLSEEKEVGSASGSIWSWWSLVATPFSNDMRRHFVLG